MNLRQNLGNRNQTRDALVDIVQEAIRWANENEDIWYLDPDNPEYDRLDQFGGYLADLQNGDEPGTAITRITAAVSYLREEARAKQTVR